MEHIGHMHQACYEDILNPIKCHRRREGPPEKRRSIGEEKVRRRGEGPSKKEGPSEKEGSTEKQGSTEKEGPTEKRRSAREGRSVGEGRSTGEGRFFREEEGYWKREHDKNLTHGSKTM